MTTRPGVLAAIVFLAAGLFVCTAVDVADVAEKSGEAGHSVLNGPHLSIEYRRGRLVFDGFTSSSAHENALSKLVTEQFGAHTTALTFKPLVTPPDYWEQVSISLLKAVATTQTASVVADEESIDIRGITDNGTAWNDNLESLRAATPPNIAINTEVVVIPLLPPVADLCLRSFSQVGKGAVGFKQSSVEIRTSSYAMLDGIIDVAYHCQDTNITITGHSDATGNETMNQRLSLARAQAVAEYLTRGGLAPDRLLVTGAGS